MYSEPTKDPLPWKWAVEALTKVLESPAELLAADARVGARRGFQGQGKEPSTSAAFQKVLDNSSLDVLKAKLLREHSGLLTSLKEHCGLQSEPNNAMKHKANFQNADVLVPSVCPSSSSAGSKVECLKGDMHNKKAAHFAKPPLVRSDCVVTRCNHQTGDTYVENGTHQMLKTRSQIQSQNCNPTFLSGGNGTEISGEKTSCSLQNFPKTKVADSVQRTNNVCADGMDILASGHSSMSKQEHNARKRKVSFQNVQLPSVLDISSTPDNSTVLLQGDSSKSTQRMLKQKVAAVESEELSPSNTDGRITDSTCQRTRESETVISQAENVGILNNPQGTNLEDTDQMIPQEVDAFSCGGTADKELRQSSKSEQYDMEKQTVGSNVQLPKKPPSTLAFDANNTIWQEDSPRKEQSMLAQNATEVNSKSCPTSVEAGDDHAQLGADTSIPGHDLPENGCSNMNPESLIVNRMANGNLASSDLQIVSSIFASEKQKLLSCQVDMNIHRDICMKCNKGGELLNCQCGITIHENCSGLQAIKNSGTFICPICSHLSAVIALGKALNTVSQTSGAFKAFLSFGFLSQQEQLPSDGLISAEFDVSNQQVESHTTIEKKNSPALKIPSQISDPLYVSSNQINDNFANSDLPNTKEHETHNEVIPGHEYKDKELAPEMSEERRQELLVDSRVVQKENYNLTNDHMGTQHLESEYVHDLVHKDISHKKSKNVDLDVSRTNQNLRSSPNTDQTRMEHLENCQGKETSTYYDNTKKKDIVEKQLAEKNKRKVKSDKICIGSSKRSSVQRRAKSQSLDKNLPAKRYSTLGRRNKLAWSDEEVEALEELVRNFASGNVKNIPWRKILEAGGNRFHKTRQPVDLKDKWRNIMKKTEKG